MPYVWSLAVAQAGIPWRLSAITLFTPTGGCAVPRCATPCVLCTLEAAGHHSLHTHLWACPLCMLCVLCTLYTHCLKHWIAMHCIALAPSFPPQYFTHPSPRHTHPAEHPHRATNSATHPYPCLPAVVPVGEADEAAAVTSTQPTSSETDSLPA